MALSTDLAMQSTSSPLKWQPEPYHESVEMEILGDQGIFSASSFFFSFFEFLPKKKNIWFLVTGHAWAISEETNDPSQTREEKSVWFFLFLIDVHWC